MATTHTEAVPSTNPSATPAGDLHPDVDVLFEEWQAQQGHVELSDLTWEDSIVFAIFWALFGVVFLQFYTRYVLNDSIGWTEEIARYLLIGVTFVGSIMAMRKGSHIAVEALLVFAPKELKHWILVVVDFVVAVFCGAMAWYGFELGNKAPGYMVSVDIPKAWMYWAVAAALAGMTVHAALRFVRRLRREQPDVTVGLVLD
jgi:TRAP-type C4-dicarboxylate transport system permease small subunit